MKTMITYLGAFYALFISSASLSAQIVTSDLELPVDTEPVTIYFDATEGTGGLAGYTGDVYAHTGVLTEASGSSSDWKYVKTDWGQNTPETRLTRLDDDYYKLDITPSIRDYYGVPEGETITHLAFVFRSAEPYSGSTYYEGKADGGKDIFVEVFEEGLGLSILTPSDNSLVEPDTDLSFQASTTLEADITLFLNNSEVTTASGVTSLSYIFNFSDPGDNWIKVTATDGETGLADSVFVHVLGTQITESMPEGLSDGINYEDAHTVKLVLYAPGKQHVFVIGDFNDWRPVASGRMKKDGDRFWLSLEGLEEGKEYAFQYYVDGSLKIADPYTEKVLDPWNDKYISEDTYPGLKPYPTGETDGITAVLQTGQDPYAWQYEFNPPANGELVIYELLPRDFLRAHDWKTLIDTLGYFKRMGINAIELMPVNEFDGNLSWGYNPTFYFAVDKYYGPAHDYKAFIDSCHALGMAVIMDMVLNHSWGQSPLVRLYYNEETNKVSPENPWYNVESPNQVFSWGYDFNHESQATKDFVDRVNTFWLEEYNVDGFRFDFTKGFTNTPGDGGFYDQDRIDILKRMADTIWKVNPEAYVILEHFAPNNEEKILSDYGMMPWGNMNHEYAEAAMGYASNLSWGLYQERNWTQPHLVTYMESHDEERLMYKLGEFGDSEGDYDTKEFETAMERLELVSVFFLTLPGPKMIWQFGELGYDYSIDYNGRVGEKPIEWGYYWVTERQKLYQHYGILNRLRRNHPVFTSGAITCSFNGTEKQAVLHHETMNALIIGNFDLQEIEADPAFPSEGTWYEYFTGDSIEVTAVNEFITMQPGEFRLYTSKNIGSANYILTGSEPVYPADDPDPRVYPNPSPGMMNISISSVPKGRPLVRVLDAQGRLLHDLGHLFHSGRPGPVQWRADFLEPGVYFIQVGYGKTLEVIKWIKQ